MSLQDHFTRPGPGVEKEAPRPKGLARFGQVLFRELGTLIQVGLVSTAGLVPLISGLVFAVLTSNEMLLLVLGAVGGAIAGPFLCALYDAILRMLRDEPFFWWHTYKKALRQDWKASLLPGALLGLFSSVAVLLLFSGSLGGNLPSILALAGMLVLLMIAPLWLAQIALMDLPLLPLLKNSLLMAFGCAPRTIPAALAQMVYWGLLLFFVPWSTIYVLMFGLWPISLIVLHTIYAPLNKNFQIEEKLAQKRAAELEEEDSLA